MRESGWHRRLLLEDPDAINATGKAGALINVDDGTYFENLTIPKLKLILQGTG
jgi:hypothetical protein